MLFIPKRFSASRRFPHLSWAWPDGHRQQLLIAAAHGDEHHATNALLSWLSTTNLDDAEFAEQRLLVTAANRLPATRLHVPNRARLNGMVRMLWTKSRLSLSDAAPALKALRAAGIELLVLKGMAVAAIDLRNLKGRIAHDVDILLRCCDLPTAFSILDDAGWRPEGGESVHFLNARGARFRSLNFLKPPYGDIDLHTRAYLMTSRDNEAESMLWTRSTRVKLLDTDVLVPSPTDRLMLAIAHGALDGHHHSDWLVDCAQLIGQGEIDWPLVVKLAENLEIQAQVVQVLFYLRDILSIAVPEEVLSHLWQQARGDSAAYFKALLLGYPHDKHSPMTSVGLRIYKRYHRAQVKAAHAAAADSASIPVIKMTRAGKSLAFSRAPPALRHRLVIEDGVKRCTIIVGIDASDRARRYVFEINTSDRHVVRLKFKDRRGRGPLLLCAEIPLPKDGARGNLWIEARQSGVLPALHATDQEAAFGARPFRVAIS